MKTTAAGPPVPRTVVVTGGASGIGRTVAERFARGGDRVAIWDRAEDEAKRVAASLAEECEVEVIGLGMDQRTPEAIQAALEATEQALGPTDILFANAGVATMSPFLELSAKEWDLAIGVNLTGTFHVCQNVARQMVAHGRAGVIVVNVSISATYNSVGLSHYCASKAGLGMLVKAMASEIGIHDIRVNGVAPGIIETRMTQDLLADPRTVQMTRSTTPLGRTGTPDEVADVVGFLASDQAAYVTGQTLMICGGQSVPSVPGYVTLDYTRKVQPT